MTEQEAIDDAMRAMIGSNWPTCTECFQQPLLGSAGLICGCPGIKLVGEYAGFRGGQVSLQSLRRLFPEKCLN